MNQPKKLKIVLLLSALLALSVPVPAQGDIFEGKPSFDQGTDLGYYVWKDGNTWHIRWTTMGQMRVFSGSVFAEGGELKSLKRIDVETERRVLYPGRPAHVVYGPRGRPHLRGGKAPVVVKREQDRIEKDGDNRIVFVARTRDDIDGFDFKADENVTSLRFVLEIDGKLMPRHVEIGRNNQKALRLPLEVRGG
jgi:hypothetical protein